LGHLSKLHTGARKVNDDEIQDEVKEELANLKDSEQGKITATKLEEHDPEEFTDVEFLEEEEEMDRLSSNSDESEQAKPKKNSHNHYILDKPNQPFYSMQRTSPEIIMFFIELLRRHNYLCSGYRNNFGKEHPERRRRVADALNRRFGLQLPAQVVGASARFLQVWFERQYVLQLSNSDFRCRYPQYYFSLLNFMPTSHISVTICEECDRRFLNEPQLELHKFRVHRGPNPNVCRVCHMDFPHASKLRQHQARYHFKPPEWQCRRCEYNAPSKWDFQQHQAMHAGQRNYTCEVCGKSCKTSSALSVHRRTHDQPRLACPYCRQRFRENYTLKCHIRRVHEEDSSRIFPCNVCRRGFASLELLELHELVHDKDEENETERDQDDEDGLDNPYE
ncbi:hypothetical protein KR009_000284, partial [Drosophila setifemur]